MKKLFDNKVLKDIKAVKSLVSLYTKTQMYHIEILICWNFLHKPQKNQNFHTIQSDLDN